MKNRRAYLYLLALVVFALVLTGVFILRNRGDGLRVEISKSEPKTAEATASEPEPQFPLDLNTAGVAELELLPGIGPVLAERILQYREETGGFTSTEDLLRIEGIGENRLEALLDYITVEGEK